MFLYSLKDMDVPWSPDPDGSSLVFFFPFGMLASLRYGRLPVQSAAYSLVAGLKRVKLQPRSHTAHGTWA
ncbi:hypothetical protein [Cupriavidus necator]|uniref:hypothetical protein n=1 Tax=Cupriavidus necator TaxID=106590 RepID=UPI0005B48B04|nr:hypothetical protein [Cupriavidus necator]